MDIFEQLEKNWQSPIVARSEVSVFSGGLLNPKTLSNLDSLGKGPSERIRIGRRIGYPVCSLVDWMRGMAEPTSLDFNREAKDA